MRVNVQRATNHPDNEGIIVSHVGLNIDRHWEDFKDIDKGDQELFHGWLEADDNPPKPRTGGPRRRLAPDMIVTGEIVDRFLSDTFLDAADDALIDNAVSVLREQGLDLEALGLTREELLRRFAATQERRSPDPERLVVQPQEHRKALRTRLDEQAKSAANRILDALDERPGGRRIALLGGTGAANNIGAVIKLVHRAVNNHLDIESNERLDQSTDALEHGLRDLDEIADGVEADLRQRLADASS